MADAQNPIPSPKPGDSDDVELALETAQRMYRNGDNAEALKWLRRAANSAEEAGDDMRQLQLARVAADLAAVVGAGPQVMTSAPSVPPPAKPSISPGGTPSRLPQPPAKQPPPAPSARASIAPGPAAPAKPSMAPAPSATPQSPAAYGGPPPLPSKSRPTPSSTTVAAAPERAVSESPPPPRASESQAPPAPRAATPSMKPKPVEPTGSGTVTAAKPIATSGPSMTPTKADKPSPGMQSGFIDIGASRGAVRVSVRVSARDETLYIVRPLTQGQRLPPGAREASLVFQQDASVSFGQSHDE